MRRTVLRTMREETSAFTMAVYLVLKNLDFGESDGIGFISSTLLKNSNSNCLVSPSFSFLNYKVGIIIAVVLSSHRNLKNE